MSRKWFSADEHGGSAVRLFCFPYAGGSAGIFGEWQAMSGQDIEIIAAHLPGRGVRLMEPPRRRLESLVVEIGTAIAPLLDRPYALFGHSMGGLIVFELARYLQARGQAPFHVFISGCSAPHRKSREEMIHKLSDPELIERLDKFNGTPTEVLAHPELLSLVLPFIRADFELVETYSYREGKKLKCPITILGGERDPETTEENLLAWQEVVSGSFKLHMIPGDHFFINGNAHQILNLIKERLAYPAQETSCQQ